MTPSEKQKEKYEDFLDILTTYYNHFIFDGNTIEDDTIKFYLYCAGNAKRDMDRLLLCERSEPPQEYELARNEGSA